MDREIIWAGSIPLDTDLLTIQKNQLVAISSLIMATLGDTTICDGLQTTQTTVPSMAVSVSPGMITFLTTVDTSQFGSEPIDNRPCMKMAINTNATTLAITAPTASGYSINYLIEAAFLEEDIDPVVLAYYNAANPSQPFSGPANTGNTNYTVRTQTVELKAKAGTQALTGEQATPVADSGYTPIAVVTVAYGATSITASNISILTAPFVGTKLGNLPTLLTSNLTLYVAPNGSDTENSGLSANVPLATPQAAWNLLTSSYNLNNFSATINVAAGSYGPLQCAGTVAGFGYGSNIYIVGAGASTIFTSGTLQAGVGASGGAQITVSNLKVEGAYGLVAGNGSSIVISSGLVFGTCTDPHILAQGGFVTLFGAYTIEGSTNAHWQTTGGGTIGSFGTSAITGTGAPNFSIAFASCITGSMEILATFSGCGSFTGAEYSVLGGGYINTNGTTFPGNSAGTTGSGANIGFIS